MRILHILEPLSYGGVEKMVQYLIKYNKILNNEVHVAIPQKMGKGISQEFYEYASIHELKYSNSYNPISTCFAISNIIRKISPDIIHTHARRPMVYTCIVNKKVPHIRTYHMEENERIPKLFFEQNLIKNRVSGWAVTWPGIIDRDLKEIKKTKKLINVIPNGVEELRVDKKNMANETLKLLFIGRLSYQKGIDILLEGLALLPNNLRSKVKLVVVGEGELKEELIAQVRDSKLGSIVSFEGFHDVLEPFFEESDIFVMPSRYEGLPLSFIESMSSATPVVSSRVGAMSTTIKNEFNGWLLDENTPEKWCDFLIKMIERGPANNVGENAKETYKSFFKVDVMCESYLKLYQEVINLNM